MLAGRVGNAVRLSISLTICIDTYSTIMRRQSTMLNGRLIDSITATAKASIKLLYPKDGKRRDLYSCSVYYDLRRILCHCESGKTSSNCVSRYRGLSGAGIW